MQVLNNAASAASSLSGPLRPGALQPKNPIRPTDDGISTIRPGSVSSGAATSAALPKSPTPPSIDAPNTTGSVIKPEALEFFQKLDADTDGYVTSDEFQAFLRGSLSQNRETDEGKADLAAKAQGLFAELQGLIKQHGLAQEGQPEGSVTLSQVQSFLVLKGILQPQGGIVKA